MPLTGLLLLLQRRCCSYFLFDIDISDFCQVEFVTQAKKMDAVGLLLFWDACYFGHGGYFQFATTWIFQSEEI